MLSSSRSSIRRCAESMRKWKLHFVQTLRFSSNSFFQIIWRQPSHFSHSPSVRTRFSSFAWISLDSRLNHANVRTQLSFPDYRCLLIFDAPLRHDALFIGVLHLFHLGDGIG